MPEIAINSLPQNIKKLIEEIQRTNKPLTITQAGVPVVVISPVKESKRPAFGAMKETGQILEDIVIPAMPEDNWEVLQ